MSSKIIVKKPTTSASTSAAKAMPKASAVVTAPSKLVVKAPQKMVVPAKQTTKIVVATAGKKAPAPKIVYQQVVEEVEEEEEQPASAQEIYERIQELLGELVGLSGGRGKIKLTKTGKIRKPRGPRENSEKQAAWMEFVKEVRASQGVDENGKFLISHKDAMKLAKEMRAEDAGSDDAEEEEEEAPAPSPAKKVVAKKATATAAPAKKSPQEIRAEFLAKQKAAAEAEASSEQEDDEEGTTEVEEFEHDGKTYLKNGDNLCWLVDAEGNQTWAGAYLPDEDRIDETVEEPLA